MSIGEYLRQQRQVRRLSIADVSSELHIRVEYLEALERDEWDKLPNGVYGLGFLRSYARYLDLDAEALVSYRKRLAERAGPETQTRAELAVPAISRRDRKAKPHAPAPMVRPRRVIPPAAGPAGSGRVVIGAGLVLVALMVGGLYLLPRLTPHPTTATGPVITGTHHHHVPKDHSKTKTKKAKDQHSSAPKPPVATVAMVSNRPQTGYVSYHVSESPVQLNLAFTGPCWVQVTENGVTSNPSGVTYSAGQTLSVTASSSVEVFVGTRNFNLLVNHQSLTLPDPAQHVFHLTFLHS